MIEHQRGLRAARVLLVGLVLAVGGAACGSDDTTTTETPADSGQDSATETTADANGTTTETSAEATTTTDEEPNPAEETEPVDEGADLVIEILVREGSVTVDEDRIDVPLGSEVVIGIETDVADEVHLHGYDVLADVSPGERTELRFVADTPGVFEIELEGSATFLVEIAVS
ncbi:MAG: hypothetical protein GY724_09595 [Actinomycetia bacterium]|nr:hypothetical protein [Actinomycetes bacterium]MCP5033739.1 hypothetical protein [Actinomycetes bacterium]